MAKRPKSTDLLDSAAYVRLRPYDELVSITEGPVGWLKLGTTETPIHSVNFLEIQEINDLVGFHCLNEAGKIRSLPMDKLFHVAWMAVRGPRRYVEATTEAASHKAADRPVTDNVDGRQYRAVPLEGDGWVVSKEALRDLFPRHELALLEAVTVFLLLGRLLEVRSAKNRVEPTLSS